MFSDHKHHPNLCDSNTLCLHLSNHFKLDACLLHSSLQEPYINLHIGATALHYGQACFEGLKAFAHEDDTVHIFRPDENAKRYVCRYPLSRNEQTIILHSILTLIITLTHLSSHLIPIDDNHNNNTKYRMQSSCQRTMMAAPPTDKFLEACNTAVKDNIEYVPPYGSNGALYVRPLLFGSGPRIGLQPADEYTLLVMVIPVGDYYKGGMSKPVDAVVVNNYDRAAPMGVGGVKVAGNYAADLLPNTESKQQGFPISLYLDAATRSVVEEFSTSNFVGIKRDTNTFVTPASPSVLPSITNKSLMALAAQELGMTVEQRDVPLNELDEFDEILAVGTAVVVTPVGSITVFDEEGVPKRYEYGDEIGETTMKLYSMMRAIQNGEVADKNEWNRQVV